MQISSPVTMPSLERQLEDLYRRRSVIERLIRSLEDYSRLTPVRASVSSKKKVA